MAEGKTLECETLIVKKTGGGPSITLKATDGGCGIWVGDCSGACPGPLVSIYAGFGQEAVVDIYGRGEKRAINIGLSVDGDGNPYVQLFKQGDQNPVMLTFDDLQKLECPPDKKCSALPTA